MSLTKAFGLAALAVVAAMAFIGTSSAAAEDGVALCKVLEELCASGHLWPQGTIVLALAKDPKLKGVLPILCEDSLIEAETLAHTASPLPISIFSVKFGVLPKPELGVGCTGCPFGLKTEVHTAPFVPYEASIKVTPKDIYKLLVNNAKASVLCGSIECVFSGHVESNTITHEGEHPLHKGKLALIPIEAELIVLKDTSGIKACGEKAIWIASYTVYLAHFGGESDLAWPSLDIAP